MKIHVWRSVDPVLARHIERVGAYRLKPERPQSLYHALARCIVYQQLTGKAAAAIFSRVEALGRRGFPSPKELLSIDDAALCGAGLSHAKALAIRDLARRTRAGELPTLKEAEKLDDASLIEKLTVVHGIGRWTVEMLLIFYLGREDVLPATDYGIRKGFQKVFRKRELPPPHQILERGERWRPHRTMASWYLWRALDEPLTKGAFDANLVAVDHRRHRRMRSPAGITTAPPPRTRDTAPSRQTFLRLPLRHRAPPRAQLCAELGGATPWMAGRTHESRSR